MKIKITGLPKLENGGGDEEWIRKILEYEATKGGYNPSRGAYGLSNWGYNSRNPTSIDEAINFFKQDYLPKVQNFPMGLKERAADFMYNTGVDPRIYLLDQYIIQNEKGMGLPGRSLYKTQGLNSPQFEKVYSQYQSKIDALPLEERIRLLDEGRDFYYQNINRVDNKPNPAYAATWQPRLNIFGSYSTPKSEVTQNQNVTQQTAKAFPDLKMQTAERRNNIYASTPTIKQFPNGLPGEQSLTTNQKSTSQNFTNPVNAGMSQPIDIWQPGWMDPLTGQPKASPTQNIVEQYPYNIQLDPNQAKPNVKIDADNKSILGTEKQVKGKTDNSYGIALASAMGTGLSFLGNTLKAAQLDRDQNTFGRMYGQTDASNPVVNNPYSRGRNVMNTGEYAPNMMTPVQFAGRPTSEYTGYPTYPYNIYAQDGLSVTRDLLGMSSLYSDFGMIPSLGQNISNQLPSGFETGETNDFSTTNESFTLPVKDFKITSGFGLRKSPKAGASSEHNGVDLSVPLNSVVFAPMDGVVEKIYENEKGGKQLIIRHSDGSKSGYAHLNDFKVSVGQSVKKGDQVAFSGNTGITTGPHLHFTFRNPKGEFVDPIDFFNMKGTNKTRYNKGLSNWDHNNPGNIHMGNFAQEYGAVTGRKDAGGNVAVFPTLEAGIKAMQDLIFSPNYADLTISQARNKWVNGNPNIPTSSAANIVNEIGADVPLNKLTSQQRKKLIEEFTKWEDRSVYNRLKKQGYFEQGGVVEPSYNTNNMKIKITGTPSSKTQFADGGKTVGDQMGYGLYRGQSVRDFNAFYKQDEDDYASMVNSTENGVPRALANIEAEEGEKVIAKDGMSILDIKGKKHTEGGTPMDVEPGSYIVSDFITAPKTMQAAMGFEIPSKKKKDNTWSKVLDTKVKSKDYNKLSQIIQAAAEGKEVDRFELAMAKAKMPVYQDYTSKAVLGNELSKMLQGKPYEIPEMAIPAMMKMFPESAEQIMQIQQMQQMQNAQQEEMGQPMAKYGMPVPQYQTKGAVEDPIEGLVKKYPWFKPFTEAKTERGRITRGGKKLSSLYDPNVANQYQNLDFWVKDAAAKGVNINNIAGLQKYIYNSLESDPTGFGQQSIQKMWEEWGPTLKSEYQNIENFADNIAGARTAFAMSQIPFTGTPAPGTSVTPPSVQQMTIPQQKQQPDFVNPEFEYSGQNLKKLPYTQDIINLSNAVANQYAYPNIGPVTGRYNPTYMDPAFISTEAIQRMIQSQGRTAMEDASLYGSGPQTQAARQAQINAQLLPAMMQNAVQTNAQNVQTDMASRQFNTQVANQAALYDAERMTMMNDKLALLSQNRAKEKIAGRTTAKNMLNQLITNAGDTYLMNQWYPQYAFNPMDYEVAFKRGQGNDIGQQGQSQQQQSYTSLYNQYLAQVDAADPTVSKEEKSKRAHELVKMHLNSRTTTSTFDPRQALMNSRRQVRTNNMMVQPDDEQKMGGFVPMYYLGGWY